MSGVDLATGHASMLHVPRWVFEDAVGFPDVDEVLAYRAGLDDTVVSQTVTDGLDQVASARRDVLCEFGGAMVRVAGIILCGKGL